MELCRSGRSAGRLERIDDRHLRDDDRSVLGPVAVQRPHLERRTFLLYSLLLFPTLTFLPRYAAPLEQRRNWSQRIHPPLRCLLADSLPLQPDQEAAHRVRRRQVGVGQSCASTFPPFPLLALVLTTSFCAGLGQVKGPRRRVRCFFAPSSTLFNADSPPSPPSMIFDSTGFTTDVLAAIRSSLRT